MASKRIRFNDYVQSGPAVEYDRKNPYRSPRIIDPQEWLQIRRELDDYKRHEMAIHPESRSRTTFYRRKPDDAKTSAVVRDPHLIVYLLALLLTALATCVQWLSSLDDAQDDLFHKTWTLIDDSIGAPVARRL